MQRWLGAVAPFSLRNQSRSLGGAVKSKYSTKAVEVLEEKRAQALAGGGEKRIAKQHKTVSAI